MNPTISKITLEKGGIINIQDEDIKSKLENVTIVNEFDKKTIKIGEAESNKFFGRHDCVDVRELKGDGGILKVDL